MATGIHYSKKTETAVAPADSWWTRPECQRDRARFREAWTARLPHMPNLSHGDLIAATKKARRGQS